MIPQNSRTAHGFRWQAASGRDVILSTSSNTLVSVHSSRNLLLTLFGRVYSDSPRNVLDARHIADRYETAGPHGFKNLDGDFAAVVCDKSKRCLFVFRDIFGGYPLFYSCKADRLTIGTDVLDVADRMNESQVSDRFVAQFLALPAAVFSETTGRDCVKSGVQRVAPGECLEFNLTTMRMRFLFQDSLTFGPQNNTSKATQSDFADAIRHHLSRSVRSRLRGKTVTHLSGGMDSTTVSYFAREQDATISGVSLVYSVDPVLAAETSYVAESETHLGLASAKISGDDCVNYGEFEEHAQYILGEPNAFFTRMPLHSKLVNAAERQHANTIITGACGDHLFENTPLLLVANAMLKCKLWSCFDHACNAAVDLGIGLPRILMDSAAIALSGASPRVRRLLGGCFDHEFRIPKFIRTGTAGTEKQFRELLFNEIYTGFNNAPLAQAFSKAEFGWYYKMTFSAAIGDQMRWSLAVPKQIHLTHPFLDRRLCELVISSPAEWRFFRSNQKELMSKVFFKQMPLTIRKRKTKLGLRGLVTRGFSERSRFLTDVLRRAPDWTDKFINRDLLRFHIEQVALGAKSGLAEIDWVNLSLSLLIWAIQEQSWQRPIFEKNIIVKLHSTEVTV